MHYGLWLCFNLLFFDLDRFRFRLHLLLWLIRLLFLFNWLVVSCSRLFFFFGGFLHQHRSGCG